MKYKSMPEYGARVRGENIVIGHFDAYTIVRRSDQSLFFLRDNESLVPTGTYVSEEGLRPISELPDDLCRVITELCEVG